MVICPECAAGMHGQCIGQGCDCECILLDDPATYSEASELDADEYDAQFRNGAR